MVEKDFVDKNDPMFRAIEGISGKLQHLYLPSAAAALSAGEERAELTSGTDTPVDGKQRKDDDTNFDDPGSTG